MYLNVGGIIKSKVKNSKLYEMMQIFTILYNNQIERYTIFLLKQVNKKYLYFPLRIEHIIIIIIVDALLLHHNLIYLHIFVHF